MTDDQNQNRDNEDLTTGEQSQESEYGERGRNPAEKSEGMFGTEDATKPRRDADDGMSGQPIGGNDSASGTGTTLTQGADFEAKEASAEKESGFIASPTRSDRDDLLEARGSSMRSDAGSTAGEGRSAQGFGGGDQLSDADGSDFAREGQGALDEEDEEGERPSTRAEREE